MDSFCKFKKYTCYKIVWVATFSPLIKLSLSFYLTQPLHFTSLIVYTYLHAIDWSNCDKCTCNDVWYCNNFLITIFIKIVQIVTAYKKKFEIFELKKCVRPDSRHCWLPWPELHLQICNYLTRSQFQDAQFKIDWKIPLS